MSIKNNSALIVVDYQIDFVDGSFAIKNSNDIVCNINNLIDKFNIVAYTKDNHPSDHITFINSKHLENLTTMLDPLTNKYKGQFPIHCVENTLGNQFHKSLKLKVLENESNIFKKGTKTFVEEFSGFKNPDLNNFLTKNMVVNVYTVGLAYDYCVGETALDSSMLGYNTYIVKDCCKSIDKNSEKEMEKKLINANVKIINYDDIII